MCGICGVWELRGGSPDEAILRSMNDRVTHRGPDDAGWLVDGPAGLAMRRLSIVDLAGGRQPQFNESGDVAVVFNGEIYNHRELREGLQARGHLFSTDSDTEVLVHLYEELGDGCVEPLNGMFTFAIWDKSRQRLLLARDRLGIKPLYLAVTRDRVLFGSELKSLLAHPGCPREVDRLALGEFLACEYIPAPRSAFAGIEKVPGGTRVIVEAGGVRRERYWQPLFAPRATPGTFADHTREVRDRLREAVRLQLRADVPLGVLLSGGLDSGSVVALMHDLGTPIETFSIGFAERDYDELDGAGEVARQFGTRHHTLRLGAAEVRDVLPAIFDNLDEPLADASVIPTYLVSRLARERVKVALSGDGGDELFGGYETYRAHRLAAWYGRVPKVLRRGLRWGVGLLPAGGSHRGLSFKAKKFLRGADLPPAERNAVWWGSYTAGELRELLTDEWQEAAHDPLAAVRRVAGEHAGEGGLNAMFHQDLSLYLQDDLLVKVDRMSMANSLEVRVPFLDHTLVEYAAGLPVEWKVKGWTLKHLLRQAMAPLLPPALLSRPKRGFDLPLGPWLRGPLKEFAGDLLSPASLREAGWFKGEVVGRLLAEHWSGRHDHRQLLWPLLVCEAWRRRYVAGAGRS
ncbi:MAG: asparagine synthase (glutamine-hydrolyzing) [Planctomycetaceae bacterium]|jgi:asparagine synthase (glutamine-hydrolysing)